MTPRLAGSARTSELDELDSNTAAATAASDSVEEKKEMRAMEIEKELSVAFW